MPTVRILPSRISRAVRLAVPVMLLALTLLPTGAHAATLNDPSTLNPQYYWFLPDLTVALDTVRLSTNDNQVQRLIGATVHNQGLTAASDARVTLQVPRFLSYQGYNAPAGVTCSYYRLPDSAYPAYLSCSGLDVAAGGSVRVSATFGQPPVTGPLSATVASSVDPGNTIGERNESNNTASLTFTVF